MAKSQRLPIREETGFGDPLGDYSDGFNILQFINDNDSQIDSSLDPNRYPSQAHAYHQNTVMNCNQNNYITNNMQRRPVVSNNNPESNGLNSQVMYTGNTRLPDSPPITDISGGNSSGSPSSTSEPPYSPDHYQNYGLVQGTPINNRNQMVVEVPDGMPQMNIPRELVNHQGQIITNRMPQQRINNGQNEYLNNYVIPQNVSLIPSINTMNVNGNRQNCPVNYMMPQQSYIIGDVYGSNNQLSSAEAQSIRSVQQQQMPIQQQQPRSDGGPVNKRKRTEPHHSTPTNIKQEVMSNNKGYTMQHTNISCTSSPRTPIHNVPHTTQTPGPQLSDDNDENITQRAIRFSKFQEEFWHPLFDENHQPLCLLEVHVVADKGFNYSQVDGCFVNQKKNHFQITVQIEALDAKPPAYVKVNNEYHRIKDFKLAFCGVKFEMPTTEIQIKQSQTDRRPLVHEPVLLEIHERRMTKATVPRLHFSETTMNNHRKNYKPNPEQRYFLLVVKLLAYTEDDQTVLVQAYQSEKVIVRASNPGQFEPPDTDVAWQRHNNTLHFNGNVAIGTEKAVAPLTVNGNIFVSGVINRPSDRRVKEDITEIDTKESLNRLNNLRIVQYKYKDEIADEWGIKEGDRHRVGVIAQELAEVLPLAVKDNGEYLTVDDSQLFYDTVAAAKELCKLTDNLEFKINKVEKFSQHLKKEVKKRDRYASISSSISEISSLCNGGEKSLAVSQYSINTIGTIQNIDDNVKSNNENNKKKRQKRICNNRCRRQPLETTTLVSRIAHISISILVLLMSCCLVAMSILYVMDWYKRSNSHYYRRQNINGTGLYSKNSDIGHLYENVTIHRLMPLPTFQPNAPILFGECNSDFCEEYCLLNKGKYDTVDQQVEELDGVVSLPDDNDIDDYHFSLSKLSTNSGTSTPLYSGVDIFLPTLNISIDSDYCHENSCNFSTGQYDLYIPVSTYMPAINIEVIFRFNNSVFVDNCGPVKYFDHKLCPSGGIGKGHDDFDNITPYSDEFTDNYYVLPIGQYIQSAYRFRVGFTSNACKIADDQRGHSYDEYTLVFYRHWPSSQQKITGLEKN
uniref:NDT80 domain-containing protein n=1 Tax=Strongyloides papillosus TaxID=174720 RepID=A0A0N5C5Q7_STREA